MSTTAIARAALVAVAAAAVLLLAGWQREADRCQNAVTELLFVLRDREEGPRLDATVDAIERDCDGSSRLVDAAGVLAQEGESDRAARLLREAAEREPESFSAWAGLAAVLARTEPRAAAEAAARARQLNPYYRVP